MNKEKPIRDQAERLRKRVERKAEPVVDKKEALPPRSEIHRRKQKKTKVRVKYPVIRMMALFFILLPITFFSIISYLEGGNLPGDKAVERAGVEFIDVKGASDQLNEDAEAASPEEVQDDEKVDASIPSHSGEGTSGGEKEAQADPNAKGEEEQKGERSEAALPADGESGSGKNSNPAEKPSSESVTIVYHTVQPKETLFRIAMNYYKSQEGMAVIREANQLKGNEIQTGQVLKIPLKK